MRINTCTDKQRYVFFHVVHFLAGSFKSVSAPCVCVYCRRSLSESTGRSCRASVSPASVALTLPSPPPHLGRLACRGRRLARVQAEACRNVEGNVALMVMKGRSGRLSTPRAPIRNMTRLLMVHSSTYSRWHLRERFQNGRMRRRHSCSLVEITRRVLSIPFT